VTIGARARMEYIGMVKIYCFVLSSPRFTGKIGRVAFSPSFGYFAKKFFDFLKFIVKFSLSECTAPTFIKFSRRPSK
jgi:hypothetical protein